MNTTHEPISAKALTPSQRRAVGRILAHYRESTAYSGCTSVRYKLRRIARRVVSVEFTTRRSDCDPYSPRAIVCEESGQFFIGPRGAIEVASASVGIHDREFQAEHRRHVARMVRGRVWKHAR